MCEGPRCKMFGTESEGCCDNTPEHTRMANSRTSISMSIIAIAFIIKPTWVTAYSAAHVHSA
jgi:hypothetical protein